MTTEPGLFVAVDDADDVLALQAASFRAAVVDGRLVDDDGGLE